MIAMLGSGAYFYGMNSWQSKLSSGLALITACGTLNSCRLFGGGEYSSQTEIQTDVPSSLEQGRPSSGPAPAPPGAYTSTPAVPVTSNLTETSETFPAPTDLPSLPGSSVPASPSLNTTANLNRDLIDIPKPDFTSVSVHNPRPPAQMISLEPGKPASPRMSLTSAPAQPYTASVVKETAAPLPVTPAKSTPAKLAPTAAEIASAPKALKSEPAGPGVPLLHSGARLSDFYASLHQPLLEQSVVENTAPVPDAANVPVPDEAALPPPPPASSDFGAPPPQ